MYVPWLGLEFKVVTLMEVNLAVNSQSAPLGMFWLLPLQVREPVLKFADDISKYILLNEKNYDVTQISMKFVLEGPIDNKSAFPRWWLDTVQVTIH